MTPQELRLSILQLAIQGKLVEQRPEEGTGEELYQQIQAEKQALIKAGKIKKEKPLPEITEEEIPFDIPETWKWVKLGDCSSYAQRKTKIVPDNIEPQMWSLDLEDVEKETGKIINYYRASNRTITGDKLCFSKGQILYSKLRPYLKKILVAPEDGICTPELVPFNTYGNLFEPYLVYVLRSPHVDYVINSVTYGVKMPRVGTETMVNLLLPLPPFEEQKRIVTKIEELMPLVDRYEEAWNRLEELNKRFPEDLQKSILQQAIQGKLVDQRPEEGTGEDLYEQIQAEKQSLIKAGKIKKEKPLPEVSEEEMPFNIPNNWKWACFGQCGSFSRGSGIKRAETVSSGFPCVRYGQLYTTYKTQFSNTISFVPKELFEKCQKVQKNDILMALTGENNFDIALAVAYMGDEEVAIGGDMTKFSSHQMNPLFLVYVINSSYGISCKSKLATGNIIVHISNDKLASIPIPLPPFEEQNRIVAKIEELLPLCEKLR